MKLSEKFAEVAATRNPEEAGNVAAFCRFRLGWNYSKVASQAKKYGGIEANDWEELLYESDALDSF